MTSPDRDLLLQARRGDAADFRKIVEQCSPRVYAVARHITGDPHEAYDIAQEVFLRLHRSLAQLDPQFAVTTWLYRVTVNLAVDHLRKVQRRAQVSLEAADIHVQPDDAHSRPDVQSEQSERGQLLRRLLNHLTTNQRKAIVLRDLEGFSIEETAEILGCRAATVRVHLSQGRSRLKEIILKYAPELIESHDS